MEFVSVILWMCLTSFMLVSSGLGLLARKKMKERKE